MFSFDHLRCIIILVNDYVGRRGRALVVGSLYNGKIVPWQPRTGSPRFNLQKLTSLKYLKVRLRISTLPRSHIAGSLVHWVYPFIMLARAQAEHQRKNIHYVIYGYSGQRRISVSFEAIFGCTSITQENKYQI